MVAPALPTDYDDQKSNANSGGKEAHVPGQQGGILPPPPGPAPAPAVVASSEKTETPMHPSLVAELRTLAQWGTANGNAAKEDSRKFWYLKAPAIALALIASVCTYFGQDGTATLATLIVGTLIVIDGIVRPGLMRNARFLAYYEARELENRTKSSWRTQILLRPTEEKVITAGLIKDVSAELSRMSGALKLIEANGPVA